MFCSFLILILNFSLWSNLKSPLPLSFSTALAHCHRCRTLPTNMHKRTNAHILTACSIVRPLLASVLMLRWPRSHVNKLKLCLSVGLSICLTLFLSLRLPLLTLFCPFIPPPSQPAASSPPSVHAVETCRAEQLVNVPCTPRVTLAQQTQIGSRLSASPALCVRPQRGH